MAGNINSHIFLHVHRIRICFFYLLFRLFEMKIFKTKIGGCRTCIQYAVVCVIICNSFLEFKDWIIIKEQIPAA